MKISTCLFTWLAAIAISGMPAVNARNEDGMTPLHIAAANNTNPDVITRLVELGADGAARTGDGKTARDLAQDNEKLRGTKAWRLLNEFRFE